MKAPPVATLKYESLSAAQAPSAKGVAQSGHGQGVPLGMQLPPVDAQQYVPWAQSPTHDVASSTVVQSAAQRGKASAVPVVSSAVQ